MSFAISGWRNALAQYVFEKIEDGSSYEERVNEALIQASSHSNFSIILLFIEKGADINAKNKIYQITFHQIFMMFVFINSLF